MQFKTLISAAALTSALTFSGAVFAQDAAVGADVAAEGTMMINGVALDDTNIGPVQERCTDLSTTATTESLIEDDSEDDGDMDDATTTAGDANATLESVPEVNEAANATLIIDLDTVTLEQCMEAGLVE